MLKENYRQLLFSICNCLAFKSPNQIADQKLLLKCIEENYRQLLFSICNRLAFKSPSQIADQKLLLKCIV